MGERHWDEKEYEKYACSTSKAIDSSGYVTGNYTVKQLYTSKNLHPDLDIFSKVRECCDSAEHPYSFPVIIGMDVTGSMGKAAIEVQRILNPLMKRLYQDIPDVEVCIMAVGDLSYDHAPLQMSQFESDIRIAEALDRVYFEGNGGGNGYESYTETWFAGIRLCKLDCWDRGKKGLIITTGDEPLNPYLPKNALARVTGINTLESDINTPDLYREVLKKFYVHHIAIDDMRTEYDYWKEDINNTWGRLLKEAFHVSTLRDLEDTIYAIIKDCFEKNQVVDSVYLGDTEADTGNSGTGVAIASGDNLISW